MIFPVFHPAAALHQPSLRADLVADFTALAAFLATVSPPSPPAAAPEARTTPVEQMTLLG